MEKNSLSKSLKDHCIGNNGTTINSDNITNRHSHYQNILKSDPRSHNTQKGVGTDHLDSSVGAGLASWPPRSYSCGFCKREFRSAQALGGHMNVHRRDRARLRQRSPPPSMDDYPILSLNPNASHSPSPNFGPPRFPSSLLSPSSPFVPHHSHSSSSSPSSIVNVKLAGFKWSHSSSLRDGLSSKEAFRTQSATSHCARGEGSRHDPLSLEISNLFGETLKAVDVDLELRLGYS
ncbi:transcriptional regulator SUPERMAN-like [Punica granatum]|uniref:C2H2-type domain-containing protein n=2 Tax=Punica granatum TaxID=22663 RepID=A0A218VRR8_PUNGR|nr:transcriptional regulator SUPERMAN-like [Punica granatum]OWM63195.1 hypothetical protein CDL15_Pgr010595 [Punica granatum]PKI65904.1 hypothetical protein CRG98_013724 [Punica granatum]